MSSILQSVGPVIKLSTMLSYIWSALVLLQVLNDYHRVVINWKNYAALFETIIYFKKMD